MKNGVVETNEIFVIIQDVCTFNKKKFGLDILTKITVPEGVTELGREAFKGML